MVARRLLTALVVALSVSGLLTWWIARKISPSAAASNAQKRQIILVTRKVAAGEVLQASMLKQSEWTASQPLPGSFDKPEPLVGRVVVAPLGDGDVVLSHDLAPADTGTGIVAKVPVGARALTIPANEIAGDTGFLAPGSLVDVLATYHPSGQAELLTATVLQSVHVLAVGTLTEPSTDPKPAAPSSVTVLVSPKDAETLTLSASLGKIVFVLRNGADRDPVSGLLSASSPVDQAPAPEPLKVAVVRRIPQALAVASAPRFTVETISGSKQTEESFGSVAK